MPNATERANARALPETTNRRAAPGVASGAVVQEVKPADKADHFERLYCQWLRARALHAESGPDEDDVRARTHACDEAGRQLLIAPAFLDQMVWRKWEVLEFFLTEDAIDGNAMDNRTVMALGCIKADLISLGIGDGGRSRA